MHFHGHVINGCTGEPVANVQFEIGLDYDIGHEEREQLGALKTDSNGYYELIVDVPKKRGFDYYYTLTIGQQYWVQITHTENATADSKDVLMDGVAAISQPFKFHIKNVSPVNSLDSFKYLKWFDGLGTSWFIINDANFIGNIWYQHLNGANVDFPYSYSLNVISPVSYFEYSFKKNGVTTVLLDTVQISCLDTTRVDIFY